MDLFDTAVIMLSSLTLTAFHCVVKTLGSIICCFLKWAAVFFNGKQYNIIRRRMKSSMLIGPSHNLDICYWIVTAIFPVCAI